MMGLRRASRSYLPLRGSFRVPLARRALLACAAWPARARAQAWPTRPVRLIVPFVLGGPADLIGRILTEPLASRWGQPVIVENRSGVGDNLGAELVARAAPDSHTLLLNTSGQVQGAEMYRKLIFDPVADFTPIAMVADYGLLILVRPGLPVSSLADFVALMRARPGEVTVGLCWRWHADATDAGVVASARRSRIRPGTLQRGGAGPNRPSSRVGGRHVPESCPGCPRGA
jgi:hypothetical protein